MPIMFPCASCGQSLKVKDELAGRAVKCPKCGKPSKVPASVPAAVPAADPEIRIIEEGPQAATPSAAPPLPARRRLHRTPPRAATSGADGRYVLQALIGGVAAAVLGAFVWYLLAKGIKAKIGWVAWGIGGATGFGVSVLSGHRGGAIFSAIGAGTALLGWLLGEYMIYSWLIQDILMKELGPLLAAMENADKQEALREFLRNFTFGDYLKATFGVIDGVFILLAAATGWGVPQKLAAR